MKLTLYRYLVKEQAVPLGTCLFGLSLILITGQLFQLIRYLFSTSASLVDLLEIIALALPQLVLYALPMAAIMGVLLAFSRLNGDNELIALKAAGVSFRQCLPAVVLVLLVTTVFSLANSLYAVPRANKALQSKLSSLGRASLPVLLKEGIFIDLIPNVVFFFRRVDPSDLSVKGIFVQDQRNPKISAAIVAESARLSFQADLGQLVFDIRDGIITRVGDNLDDAQAIVFKTYELSLPLDEMVAKATKGARAKREMMTLGELLEIMNRKDPESVYSYALEFHKRFALPVSCLLLGLAGAPLGAIFRQTSRLAGIAIGLSLFIGYYILLSAGNGLGKQGFIPCFLAVWMPNLMTLLLAILLWHKAHSETVYGLAAACDRLRTAVVGACKAVWLCRRPRG